MFYQESEISSLLICPACDCKYEDPRMLACGKIICKFCVQKLEKKFVCSFCSKTHTIPDEGLPECETISKLLSIQPNEVHRSDHVKLLKANLDEIEKKIGELSFSLNNGVDFIKEYCIVLRNDVQFATEKAVKEINEFSEEMINKINTYEKERIKDYQELKEDKDEFTKFVDEMKNFHIEWVSYLKHFEIKDQDVLNANTRASELKIKSEEQKTKLDNFNFNGRYLKYHKNLNCVEKKVLGLLSPGSVEPLWFEKLKKVNIRGTLSDCNSILQVEMMTKDTFIISYNYSSGYSSLKIIDKNMNIQCTYHLGTGYGSFSQLSFTKGKKKIAMAFYCSSGCYFLKALNGNLSETKSIQTNCNYKILGSNDNNIFCLTTNVNSNHLIIYDWNLKLIKSIGQFSYPNNPFYFPANLIQLENKNKKYYWLNSNTFNILDETTGIVFKTFPVNATKFHLNSNETITLFCNTAMELMDFDLNGNKMGTAKLHNFPTSCSAFFDDDERVQFFDFKNFDTILQN